MSQSKVALVAGVGPGNGEALARRFARGGYRVALLARNGARMAAMAKDIPGAAGFACDVTEAASVQEAFDAVRGTLGPIDALLFNAGSGIFKPFAETTAGDFEISWRVNALGSLLCSQAVIPEMIARNTGTIVFTGATASVRGGPTTAAFAPAKAAQRSLAQAMARSLGPLGIHVGIVVVDGFVDTPRIRAEMPDKPDEFFVTPSGFADIVWFLANQDRQAWTFELDARPFHETW